MPQDSRTETMHQERDEEIGTRPRIRRCHQHSGTSKTKMQTNHHVVLLGQMPETKEMCFQSDQTVSSSVYGKNEHVFTRERLHFATIYDQRTRVDGHHSSSGH